MGTNDRLPLGIHTLSKHGISINVEVDERTVEFWAMYKNDEWEKNTFAVFDAYLRQDKAYIDIGAWVGPTLLYGANKAKFAFGFEPDKAAFNLLGNNIRLNPHLIDKTSVCDYGIGSKTGKVKFYVGSEAESTSSFIPNHYNNGAYYYVDFYNFSEAVERCSINFFEINFIKIDIEGGEYTLVPTMIDYFKKMQHFPTLLISTHAPFVLTKNLDEEIKKKVFHDLTMNLFTVLDCYRYNYCNGLREIKNVYRLGTAPIFFDIVASNIQLSMC